MNLYLETHIVQKGENLENIITKYNIPEVEMLRYFHNQNVPKNQPHIGSLIFPGQEIFIPSKGDIEKMLFTRREKIVRQNESLKDELISPNIYAVNQSYKVKIKHSSANNPENVEILEFDSHIKYLGKSKDNLSVLEYRKGNYLINNELPDSKLDKLAVSATDFLYPLQFCLNPETFKPHIIHNIKDIRSRWNTTKENSRKMYIDSYSSRYINIMDEALKEGFNKYFMNDIFIQFLFAPYVEFTKGLSVTEKYFQTYRIAYQDTMAIKVFEDTINISQNASCTDSRTAQQILANIKVEDEMEDENNELIESEISGNYQLDKYDKTLQKAKIKIRNTFYDEGEVIEIEIDSVS